MRGEQTIAAVERRFRPRGAGRFGSAAFLVLWLCAWAVGEAFALLMIGHGIYSLVTGRPALGSDQPLRLGPALAAGCFLIVWLTIWTVGGIMAIRELLRSWWAEDRLVLDREVLTRSHRLGPFVFTKRLPRDGIRRVFVQRPGQGVSTLVAQLGPGLVELTDLGTPAERDEAASQLRAALGLADEDHSTRLAALPESWQEITSPRGDALLVPNLHTRRQQALFVAAIAIVVWTMLVLLAWESLREPNLWVVTAMVSALAVWLARQTVWMHQGRKEWRLRFGTIVWQRRFGLTVTELAEARALELTESIDSDGDRWYELRAIELSQPAFTRARKIPPRLKIDRAIHDPTEPRCLGLWLSQRTGIPFHDRVPDDAARRAETARLRELLGASGKSGSFLARLFDGANRSRNNP